MKKVLLAIVTSVCCLEAFSQGVIIDPSDTQPLNSSAVFQAYHTNKGVLLPSVSLTATGTAAPVTGPATGLMVYNNNSAGDVTPGFYFWNGSAWQRLLSGTTNISGTGTTDYLARWTPSGTVLGTGATRDDGTQVGIGTAPVAGTRLIVGPATGANIILINDINTAEWQIKTGGYDLSFANDFDDNGTYDTRLFLEQGGNVGVGTTNPVQKLEVTGGRIRVADAGTGVLELANTSIPKTNYIFTDGSGHLNARTDAATNHVLLQTGGTQGNVGIGVASPGQKLAVQRTAGSSSSADIYTSDGTQWMTFNSNSTGGAWNPMSTAADHTIIYTNGTIESGGLLIGQWSNSSKGIRIDATGNVGIATALPNQKLEVAGNTRITGLAGSSTKLVQTNNSGDLAVSSIDPSTVMTTTNISGTTNYVAKFTGTNSIGNSQIFDNGTNVGIGVNPPTASKLQVEGGWVSGNNGGWFSTKWSGDNHHGIWYRASVSADGSTVSAADAMTYREYGSASLGHHFWTGAATMTERFRITNNYAAFLSGNVGIATATTNNRMEFLSDNSAQALQFNTSGYVATDAWGTRIYKSDIGGGIPLKHQTQFNTTWYDGVDMDHGQDAGHPSLKAFYHTQLATAGGNVGIGMTAPVAKLHVTGNSRFTGDVEVDGGNTLYFGREESFGGSDVGGADYGFIRWDNDNNSYNRWGDSGENGALIIGSQNDGANSVSDVVVLNGVAANIFDATSGINYFTGNVGIGTYNPVGKLHVSGTHGNGVMTDGNDRPSLGATGSYPQLVLMAGGTGNTSHGSTIMLGSYDSGTSGNHKHWSIGTAGNGSTFLDIGYHAGTDLNPHAGIRGYNGSTFMTILNSGYIGIGTTNPNTKLTVDYSGMSNNFSPVEFRGAGVHSWGVNLVLRTTGGTDGAGLLFRNRDAKNWQIRGETSSTGFQITEDGGDGQYGSGFGTPRLHISAGGNVGIGQTAPNARLEVVGNATTAAIISAGGTYYTDWPGGWGGGLASWDLCIASMKYSGLTARSDIRLKKEITELNSINALEIINQMRPVSYRWIDERLPQHLNYGLIAQEIEQLLPDLVDTGVDSMQTKGLHYMDLIPILIQGMKDQQKEIEALKAGNASSADNLQMKNEIAELKKMVLELRENK